MAGWHRPARDRLGEKDRTAPGRGVTARAEPNRSKLRRFERRASGAPRPTRSGGPTRARPRYVRPRLERAGERDGPVGTRFPQPPPSTPPQQRPKRSLSTPRRTRPSGKLHRKSAGWNRSRTGGARPWLSRLRRASRRPSRILEKRLETPRAGLSVGPLVTDGSPEEDDKSEPLGSMQEVDEREGVGVSFTKDSRTGVSDATGVGRVGASFTFPLGELENPPPDLSPPLSKVDGSRKTSLDPADTTFQTDKPPKSMFQLTRRGETVVLFMCLAVVEGREKLLRGPGRVYGEERHPT